MTSQLYSTVYLNGTLTLMVSLMFIVLLAKQTTKSQENAEFTPIPYINQQEITYYPEIGTFHSVKVSHIGTYYLTFQYFSNYSCKGNFIQGITRVACNNGWIIDDGCFNDTYYDVQGTYCYEQTVPKPTKTPLPPQTPKITPIITPLSTPMETPYATPMETLAATPLPTCPASPIETPNSTPNLTPMETPEETPISTPYATPNETLAATPMKTLDATPLYTPEETPISNKYSMVYSRRNLLSNTMEYTRKHKSNPLYSRREENTFESLVYHCSMLFSTLIDSNSNHYLVHMQMS